jgi:hypothetical protein
LEKETGLCGMKKLGCGRFLLLHRRLPKRREKEKAKEKEKVKRKGKGKERAKKRKRMLVKNY